MVTHYSTSLLLVPKKLDRGRRGGDMAPAWEKQRCVVVDDVASSVDLQWARSGQLHLGSAKRFVVLAFDLGAAMRQCAAIIPAHPWPMWAPVGGDG